MNSGSPNFYKVVFHVNEKSERGRENWAVWEQWAFSRVGRQASAAEAETLETVGV